MWDTLSVVLSEVCIQCGLCFFIFPVLINKSLLPCTQWLCIYVDWPYCTYLSSGLNMPLPLLTCMQQKSNLFMCCCLCSSRTLRSKKQQSSSSGLSLSLSQAATPRKTLSFSAISTPVNNSRSVIVQESSTASDASLLTPIVDQSHLRQRTITTTTTTTSASVDGHWGQLFKILIPTPVILMWDYNCKSFTCNRVILDFWIDTLT